MKKWGETLFFITLFLFLFHKLNFTIRKEKVPDIDWKRMQNVPNLRKKRREKKCADSGGKIDGNLFIEINIQGIRSSITLCRPNIYYVILRLTFLYFSLSILTLFTFSTVLFRKIFLVAFKSFPNKYSFLSQEGERRICSKCKISLEI